MMGNLIKRPAARETLPRAEISIGQGASAHEEIGIKKPKKEPGTQRNPGFFGKIKFFENFLAIYFLYITFYHSNYGNVFDIGIIDAHREKTAK